MGRLRRRLSIALPRCIATLLRHSLAQKNLHTSEGRTRGGGAAASEFSSFFTFMYFRSSTRRRFPLQFDLIVINGGTYEIF